MTTPIVKTYIEKTNILKCHKKNKHMQHEMCEIEDDNIIKTYDNLDNATNNNDVIHYWHETFQLTKKDENTFLNQNGWLNNQHLGTTMQILYEKNLQFLRYKQHTYAIMETIYKIIKNLFIVFSSTIIIGS
jgi:hypothetical protein